ncbi:MAG: hypothetical protein K940chlam1_00840, partial [Candidatus Anoxychlamydiales bacterium]|nr:hypothetical protein [Candidatus Anoxychlamydiales bacterium]NGX36707.1 hypothetical protein [Candidatus Anoxychlamydiales bacterium]
LLPAMMVFSKRYVQKETTDVLLFGGKTTLFIIFLFVIFTLSVEVFQEVIRIVS